MVSSIFQSDFLTGNGVGTITSDIFSNETFSLFEKGEPGTADDFLFTKNVNLVNETVTVLDNTFALVGFGPEPPLADPLTGLPNLSDTYAGMFDVA